MAYLKIEMPVEIMAKLKNLGDNSDELMSKTLKAGADAALPIIKSSLTSAISSGTKFDSRTTGELVDSLGISPVNVNNQGNANVKIGFTEPRSKQYPAKRGRRYDVITNAMIANVLEYGKPGQPGKRFLSKSKTAALKAANDAMESAFYKEVEL